jgi:uncharacterized membrane protein YebE (DUF533 family)
MLSKDEFYMWRTLFALAHIDEILTKEEKQLIQSKLPAEELSEEQKQVLDGDVAIPQDPLELFEKISDVQVQKRFFDIAYELVLVDGDYHKNEYSAIHKLQKIYDDKRGVPPKDSMVIDIGFGDDD